MALLHLLNACVHAATSSRQGWSGMSICSPSALEVGIQKASLPSLTSVLAAKARMSSSIARKPYGFFGGI